MRGQGVDVTALCPGPVRTEFTEVAHREKQGNASLGPALVYVSVEEVVRAALRGIETRTRDRHSRMGDEGRDDAS